MIPAPVMRPSPHAIERFQDLVRKVRLPQSEGLVWRELLTVDERRLAEKSKSMGPDIISIWSGVKGVTSERALVDLAKLLGYLHPDEGQFLMRTCGQTDGEPRPRPRFHEGKVLLGDRVVRSVKLYRVKESKVEVLFNAFEGSDWSNVIPNPFPADSDDQYVYRAVNLANKNLAGIRLEVRRGGEEIAWSYSN